MKKLFYSKNDIMFICDSDANPWKELQKFAKMQIQEGCMEDPIEITDVSQVPEDWKKLCVWHSSNEDITPEQFFLTRGEWEKARKIYFQGKKMFDDTD